MGKPAPVRSVISLNRRAHPRYTLLQHQATLHIRMEQEPIIVRNISAAGLMATIYSPRLPGDLVRIELQPGALLDGSVLWVKDWQVGIGFDQPIDVERLVSDFAEAGSRSERRSAVRRPIDCAAKLRVKERYYFGRAADISYAGARFATASSLKEDGPAWLMLPDLPPLGCVICWTSDQAFGLEFSERLPEQVLDTWLVGRVVSRRSAQRE